jgi:branched-chain amino acid transport system permease protein
LSIYWQLFLQGLVDAVVYLLIASGFSVIYSTTKHFHISHAGVFTLAGYFLYVFTAVLGLPIIVGFILTLILMSITGTLILRGVYFPVIKRGGTHLILFIASLGLLTVIYNVLNLIFTPDPMRIENAALSNVITIFGASITVVQLLMIIVGVIILAALYMFMNRSKTGRLIKAVSVNPDLSRIVGISMRKIYIICYALGSLLVSIPGMYLAFDTGAQTGKATELVIVAIMAVIMGGSNSLVGCWIVSLFVGLFNYMTITWIPPHWQTAIIFTLFLLMIMLRPTGLLGQRA